MRRLLVPFLGAAIAASSSGCGSTDDAGAGGDASVTIAGTSFEVGAVTLVYQLGEDGYFRVEGNDAAHPDEDCVPGLGGRMALYGGLPATVTSVAGLAGLELPFEFTGDGDDANLCFVGSNGLLGVESGTVRFVSVDGARVAFSFSGSFALYDGEGGQAPAPVAASGAGTAVAVLD